MSLRKRLNNNELAKKVNYSSVGQAFETSDFAISVEAQLRSYPENFKKDTLIGLLSLIASPVVFPLAVGVGYTGLKLNYLFRREHYDTKILKVRESLQYSS